MIIDQYTRQFDEKDILRKLGMPEDHAFGENLKELLEKTDQIAKPKAYYEAYPIESRSEDTVVVAGVTLTSKILVKKLKEVEVVYPYLSTCGKELADYARTLTDGLEIYAFDTIMEYYLKQIDAKLSGVLADLVPEKRVVSNSNPGSLIDWPIQEERRMFDIFGKNADEIGVVLNDSFLMFPVKSVAGIKYGTKGESHDCELCQRSHCPSRKAPFSMKAFLAAKSEEDMM